MSKPPLLIVDNLDTRREVWQLLKRLSPAKRIEFLTWCCERARPKRGQGKPFVNQKTLDLAAKARWDSGADERLHHEVWGDLWTLVNSFGLSPDAAQARLVQMARGKS